MNWTVQLLIEATQGKLLQGSPALPITRISTDTRTIEPGCAFLALMGEHHDGHDFVPEAVSRGASAVVVEQGRLGSALPRETAVVAVADTLRALGDLARSHRRRHPAPVIGISGSNGKTSTKEMAAAILGTTRKVLKNSGNLNNLIGVPLTLLTLSAEHQVAVVEMGINVPGEMQRLVEIVEPTVGLVTNVHPAHLEGLQSIEGILAEKGRLLTGLGTDGVAVVNLDDDGLRRLGETLGGRKVTYSLRDPEARVRLLDTPRYEEDATVFTLGVGRDSVEIRLAVLGLHHVQNALAAAAVAHGLGVAPQAIATGLAAHRPVKQRMQIHRLQGGGVLIDDTYNANPMSVLAAVRTLMAASGGRQAIAVLGEMRELGPDSALLHRDLGRQIARLGISRLATLGELAAEISMGAQEAGMKAENCYHGRSHEDLVSWLRGRNLGDGWVLVKGSRGMTMERVVEGVLA